MQMREIHPEILKAMKERYKAGTRVKLNYMNDVISSVPDGTLGTVACVDDVGTIHVNWDNGRTLGVVYREDSCSII